MIWLWLTGAAVFAGGSLFCFRTARMGMALCLILAAVACAMLIASLVVTQI